MSRIIIFTFIIVFLASACATTPSALPEKYNLDSDLESVDQIFATFSRPRLEQVDNQSIILRTNWNDYYLLVLRRPIDTRYSNPSIGISRTVSCITSGLDRVSVIPSGGIQSYVIDTIYKLKGMEQAEEIKERLRKN
jgi:hypothetical protein